MTFLFWLNIGFDKGGPSVHLLQDVIRQALQRGHLVEVILKDTKGDSQKVPMDFLENEAFRYTLVADADNKKTSFFKRYINELSYAQKCKKIFRKNQYDVVFLQSCNAAAFYVNALKCLKCPIVFNVQDIFPQNLMFSNQLPLARISYPILNGLQKYAYRKATKIITISDDMKCTLLAEGIDESKVDVVYNWSYGDDAILWENIPTENFFDLSVDSEKTNVVYAGNIGKMQNVEVIAQAAVISQNDEKIHYYIIGDGANKDAVCDLVNGLTNVTVLPMQPARYAESIYAQADINVIPLAVGGIKTALPSKTATILRTDTNVIFCIDPGSEFENRIKGMGQISVVDNKDPAALYQAICEIRERKNICPAAKKTPLEIFSTKNATHYVEIMERFKDIAEK